MTFYFILIGGGFILYILKSFLEKSREIKKNE